MKSVGEMKLELRDNILAGKYTRQQVKLEMQQIVDIYGQDAFPPYLLTKKEKPWTQAYLDELASLAGLGADSQEFFLHMQEVKEELQRKKRNLQHIIAGAAAVVALIIAIVALLTRK